MEAQNSLEYFIKYTKREYAFNWHHKYLCGVLDQFAKGQIDKLMVFMPPQHGKSELTTRRLPAYMVGLNPDLKIAICSYSATIASNFNRDVQRIIDDAPYYDIFPGTSLNENSAINPSKNTFLRNSEVFEIIGRQGFVKTVGVGGSLTGTPVDIGIIDDPFKDREEAMSSRIRDKVYSWYTDVFKTRLHNKSQQLLVMTRWDQDDLAGRILKSEEGWQVVTFQAIKERETLGDPREIGQVLWPERHSLERILAIKETSPFTFNSLYQQDPKPSTEALVYPEWDEYTDETPYIPVYGLDFGFSNDPTAITQVKVHNKDMWIKEMLYKKGLTTPDLDIEMSKVMNRAVRIGADSADPRSIEDLKRRGWQVFPSKKGPDSIVNGINWVKGFRLHIHKDSHNLKNELLNYQWLMYDGKATNMPIDSHNHLMDSLRYSKDVMRMGNTSAGIW
jgi:hypothetical protein